MAFYILLSELVRSHVLKMIRTLHKHNLETPSSKQAHTHTHANVRTCARTHAHTPTLFVGPATFQCGLVQPCSYQMAAHTEDLSKTTHSILKEITLNLDGPLFFAQSFVSNSALFSFRRPMHILPWPKKIETTARTWRRRVISRACTRLCLACVAVSSFGWGSSNHHWANSHLHYIARLLLNYGLNKLRFLCLSP